MRAYGSVRIGDGDGDEIVIEGPLIERLSNLDTSGWLWATSLTVRISPPPVPLGTTSGDQPQ